MADKDEYPPLLGGGLHRMSLEDLRGLVVDRFPRSARRQELWNNLTDLVEKIRGVGLTGELWIDGSYLTEKIDPGDVDFVFDLPISAIESANAEQQALLSDLSARAFRRPECLHSFVMFAAPPSHPGHAVSVIAHNQWQKDFGFSYVKKEPKGIAVIEVRQ